MKTREVESKPKTQSTDTEREHEGLDRPQQPQATFAQFLSPGGQPNPPPGNCSSPQYYAGILRRAKASGPSNMRQAMLQLQRQHGNHFVHRVIEVSRKDEGGFGGASNREGLIQTEPLTHSADIGPTGAFLNISASGVQRKCAECEGEIERKPKNKSTLAPIIQLTHTLQQSPNVLNRKGENVSGSQAVFDFAQLIVNGAFSGSEFAEALATEDFTSLQLRDLKERVSDMQTTSDPLIDAALEEIDNVLAGRTDLKKVQFVPTPCEPGDSASVNANAWTTNERLIGIAEGTEAPLKKGGQGEAVKLVQQALLQWGCEYSDDSVNLLPKFRDDGDFGFEMKLGVEEFQKRNGLGSDGVVGFDTLFNLQEKVVLQSALDKEAAARAELDREEAAAQAELSQLRDEESAREEWEGYISSLAFKLGNFAYEYRDMEPAIAARLVANQIYNNGGELITDALSRLSIEHERHYDEILYEGMLQSALLDKGVEIELPKPPKGGDFIDGFVNTQKELESEKTLEGPDFDIWDAPLVYFGFQFGIAEGLIKGSLDTVKLVIDLFDSEFWNQMSDAVTDLVPKIIIEESFRYQLGEMAAELIYKQLTDLNASSAYNYGSKLGVLFGQLVFEVALGILTAGAGAAVKAGKVGALLSKYPKITRMARAIASNALVRGGVKVATKLAENISGLTKRISNLVSRARFALPDLTSAAKAERAATEILLDEKLQKALRNAEDAVAKAERIAAKAVDDVDAISKAADEAVAAEKKLAQSLDEYLAKTGRGVSEEAFEVMEHGRDVFNVPDVPPKALEEEFRFVAKATPETKSIKAHGREYDLEVDLPNNHTYRREKGKGTWCRFSGPPGKSDCDLDIDGAKNGVKDIPSSTKSTGIKGGKPTGKRTDISPDDDKVTQRSHELENDSADVLANAGYKVEQNPKVPGNKNPDYLIEGKVFDNKAPSGPKPRNAASEIEKAVKGGQADRIILNLKDAKFTPKEMKKQLDDWPIEGLKEVIVIKDGQVIPFWP